MVDQTAVGADQSLEGVCRGSYDLVSEHCKNGFIAVQRKGVAFLCGDERFRGAACAVPADKLIAVAAAHVGCKCELRSDLERTGAYMTVCIGAEVIATVEGDGGATAVASLRYTQRCTAFGEYCLDLRV